ncbi:hypothetical protein [Brassicibacter mesophilus]|uniref:hypothetical protein n=1 Tax=Brassicibacter mesophilus TaxID=745119 RepID=UPI003D1ACC6A
MFYLDEDENITTTIPEGTIIEVESLDDEFFDKSKGEFDDLLGEYKGKYILESFGFDPMKHMIDDVSDYILVDNDFEIVE